MRTKPFHFAAVLARPRYNSSAMIMPGGRKSQEAEKSRQKNVGQKHQRRLVHSAPGTRQASVMVRPINRRRAERSRRARRKVGRDRRARRKPGPNLRGNPDLADRPAVGPYLYLNCRIDRRRAERSRRARRKVGRDRRARRKPGPNLRGNPDLTDRPAVGPYLCLDCRIESYGE